VAFVAALGIALGQSPQERQEAEKLFREVYGKEYDRVNRAKGNSADRVSLAKRLWDGARESIGNRVLAKMLADKAVALISAEPAGYSLAYDIKRAYVPLGKDRAEHLAATATLLDKLVRIEKADQRLKHATELVDLHRDASEAFQEQGHHLDAASHLNKAAAAARLYLPPDRVAATLKEIAADSADVEGYRRETARVRKALEAVKQKPDDPKANQGAAIALLRTGQLTEATTYLLASQSTELCDLGKLLSSSSRSDGVRAADLLRAVADRHPADQQYLLTFAAYMYEAALKINPMHPEAARISLLAKNTPRVYLPGTRPPSPGATIELVDEKPEVVDALAKGSGTSKVLEWTTVDRYSGRGALRIVNGLRSGPLGSLKATLVDMPAAEQQYRYLRFAIRQIGGTQLRIALTTDNNIPVVSYNFGKRQAEKKEIQIADFPPSKWTVHTRDAWADCGQLTSPAILGLLIETDGEALIDFVYLGRSVRELNRQLLAVPPPGQ
jgi:hypothetical protein